MRSAVLAGATAAAIAAGLWLGLPQWTTRRANLRELGRPTHSMPPPARGDRLLVLAPHCDDETLGCGGLIARALAAGARVRVALLTNGDGARYGASRLFREIEVEPADYLRMAARRQQESLAALSSLGLKQGDVIFLGYPDGGTGLMWSKYWDARNPYRSPHTLRARDPYRNSLRPGAPYCGRAVIGDLRTVLGSFRPTAVFCPHPSDSHPDHWGLCNYASAALYETGMLRRVRVYHYLVHRGDWPVPRGLRASEPMKPPAKMLGLGTQWEALSLTPAQVQEKRRALMCYRSQMLVMSRFLLSFVRRSELFGEIPPGRLPRVRRGAIRVDGKTEDWRGIAAALRDPAQDLGAVDVAPAADIVAAHVAVCGGRLCVRLDLWRRASSLIEYRVHVHPLLGRRVGPPRTYALRPGRRSPGVEFRSLGRHLEVSVPWPYRGVLRGIMLSADSRLERHVLDRTACVLLFAERG